MSDEKNVELEKKYLDNLCAMISNPAPEGESIDEYAETTVGMFHYVCVQHAAYATERFVDVVKNNGMYMVNYPLYDEALVLYYCFQGEYEKAEEVFSNMRKNPMRNLACYYSCIKLFCAYGRGEFVNRVLNPVVVNKSIKNDDIQLHLIHIKLISFLEDNYKKSPSNISASKLNKFDKLFKLGYDEDLAKTLQATIFSKNEFASEEVVELERYSSFVDVLRFMFFRYMYDNGIGFIESDIIFANAFEVIDSAWTVLGLRNRNITRDVDFDFKYDDWINAIDRMPNEYILEVGSCEISAVWGAVYLYEFLYELNFLTDKQYSKFCKIIKKVKLYVMALYLTALWKMNFVHVWKKPDSVSDKEFEAEKIFFGKTIFMKTITPREELKRVFQGEENVEVINIVKSVKALEQKHSLFDKYCDQQAAKMQKNGEYDLDDLLDTFERFAKVFRNTYE
ncbi:MAG: hypothetical protein PF692_04865 [Kiritimatiellae bacterium]|jgi:hypothetical protein|nr:hypothetical protein [Kiritimatiellia bacterium]